MRHHNCLLMWPSSWDGRKMLDEWIDAEHPAAPLTTSSPRSPSGDSDQWHATTTGGAQPKTSIAPLVRCAAASRAKPRCTTTPDPVEHPAHWIQAYVAKTRRPPSWWPEFCSLYKESTRGLADIYVQELAKNQAMAFRLPKVQDNRSGWWEAPCSISTLCCKDI